VSEPRKNKFFGLPVQKIVLYFEAMFIKFKVSKIDPCCCTFRHVSVRVMISKTHNIRISELGHEGKTIFIQFKVSPSFVAETFSALF